MSKIPKIIIGSKPLMNYIEAVCHEFESGSIEVDLSAIGTNVNKLERIVHMITVLTASPIIDNGRKREPIRDMTAIVCRMRRKGG